MTKKKNPKISKNPMKMKVKDNSPKVWCGGCQAEYGKCKCDPRLRD